MPVLDCVDVSDDEETVIPHAAQLEVDIVDLTSDEDDVDEGHSAHEKGDTAQLKTTLHRQEFVAAHGILCEQDFVGTDNGVEEAMQPSNQEFLVAADVVKEARQHGHQEITSAVGCAEEVMQSENASEAAMSSTVIDEGSRTPLSVKGQGSATSSLMTEVAMRSANQDFVAAGISMEEAVSEHVPEVFYSSITKQGVPIPLSVIEQRSHETDAHLSSPPISTAAMFPRQFWKAGEYKVAVQATINNGQNCLRIHPKFLHSNATSHKWAFGAIAELLDNALDEVQNGATFVKIDKIKYSPDGEYSLVIQDDGGGMSPEYLRHCMSFGFSNKCMNSSIGQYGNGFKTSTMRLGADVIVFSCRQDTSTMTRSVGLLSYTFLTNNACNDILVPMVDYEFDASSHTFKRIMDRGERHYLSNLLTLLRWSPFSTEDELLNQFGDIGFHGTKIIVFNLWFNDAQEMELDFSTDDEDILISGAPKLPEECSELKRLKHMHVAERFRYSLRVYASILYLRLPENFEVILCGRVVEPHQIARDLIYFECIKYRPQAAASIEVPKTKEVDVIIGFLKGAPKLDICGFNVYHRNRLILPFCRARSMRRGRGIVGVLEANFIRPTHDKQDFERTELFDRLDVRLRDMTYEYWKTHGHLVGYNRPKQTHHPRHCASLAANDDDSLAAQATKSYVDYTRRSAVLEACTNGRDSCDPSHTGALRDQMSYGGCSSTRRNMRASLSMPRNAPQQTESYKRRNSCSVIEWRAGKRQIINDNANQPGSITAVQMGDERRLLLCENKNLKAECSDLDAAEQQLLSKAEKLREELRAWQAMQKDITDELKFFDGFGALQHNLHYNAPYTRPY